MGYRVILAPTVLCFAFHVHKFNLVNAAVVCAILESISGLEPLSVIIEPRYLKLLAVSSFCLFTFICVDATGVVCHQPGLHGTDLHALGCGGFVEMLN